MEQEKKKEEKKKEKKYSGLQCCPVQRGGQRRRRRRDYVESQSLLLDRLCNVDTLVRVLKISESKKRYGEKADDSNEQTTETV